MAFHVFQPGGDGHDDVVQFGHFHRLGGAVDVRFDEVVAPWRDRSAHVDLLGAVGDEHQGIRAVDDQLVVSQRESFFWGQGEVAGRIQRSFCDVDQVAAAKTAKHDRAAWLGPLNLS